MSEWADAQRNKLADWAEQQDIANDKVINKILKKPDFTNEDLDYLRSFPGFSKVESQIAPVSKSSLAKKLVSEYSSIDEVPKAYLADMKKEGLTNADIEEAFTSKKNKQDYDQMMAEQEMRKKDLEELSDFSTDKSLTDNALALAAYLVPKEADRYYIRHGVHGNSLFDAADWGLSLSALLGGVANVLELLPTPFLGTIGAPVLRKLESVTSDEKYDWGDAAKDAGMNALGYAPFMKIGELAKSALGSVVGPAFEKTSGAKKISDFFQAMDNASLGDKAITNRKKLQDEFMKQYSKMPNMDKVQIEKLAREMDNNNFPVMAKMARDYNISFQGGSPLPKTVRGENTDLLYPNNYELSADRKKLLYAKSKKEMDPNKPATDATKRNRQATIDRALAKSANKPMVALTKATDLAGRPVFRWWTNPEMDTNMVRQWEAGFVPRKGTDLYEQYLIWARNREQSKETK